MTLKRATELTRTFRNNVKDCTPEFVGKMKIKMISIREGYNIHIMVNDKEYKLSRMEAFFRNFIGDNIITLKNYVIQEEYVFTSVGLVKKADFEEAQKVMAENEFDDSDIISPRNLVDREIYQLSDGRVIYHLGIYLKNSEGFYLSEALGKPALLKKDIANSNRYFIELKLNKDNEYIPIKIYSRKQKDIVVKQLFISFDESKIEAFTYNHILNKNIFSISNPKDISSKEINTNIDFKYTYGYLLAKRGNNYFISSGSTWNKEIFIIKDYNHFKSEVSKFRNSAHKKLDLMEFLEREKILNFEGLESISYFYERG